MRFLADENVPRRFVDELSAFGHDVVWIRMAHPGASDSEIVEWAIRDSRVVLTFDKDFGELAWQANLPASFGVILFPIAAVRTEASRSARRPHHERSDWPGHFSVVEADRVRMRPLATK